MDILLTLLGSTAASVLCRAAAILGTQLLGSSDSVIYSCGLESCSLLLPSFKMAREGIKGHAVAIKSRDFAKVDLW